MVANEERQPQISSVDADVESLPSLDLGGDLLISEVICL